jgi:hypothetical protein
VVEQRELVPDAEEEKDKLPQYVEQQEQVPDAEEEKDELPQYVEQREQVPDAIDFGKSSAPERSVSTVVKMVAARKTEKKAEQEKAERAKAEQEQREQRREQQRVEVRQRKAAAEHQKNLEMQWSVRGPPPQKTPEQEKAGLTLEEKCRIMGRRAQLSPKGEGEGCDTSDWENEDAGAKVRPPAALTRRRRHGPVSH